MKDFKSRLFLIFCGVLYFTLPYTASRIRWKGTSFPQTPPGFAPGYGLFTDQEIIAPPGLNITYFIIMSIACLIILCFLLFPELFGFKKNEIKKTKTVKKGSFPVWFFPSLIIMIISWILMWTRWPHPVDEYSFVPLWWGFILSLDGLVYRLNNGKSILSTKPGVFKLIFAVSSVAWFSFEYINFFYVELWYYPNNKIFTNFGFIFWYLLSFTVVWPGIFEFYTLIRCFKPIGNRYCNGPCISLPRLFIYIGLFSGFILAFVSALFPRLLFWGIWVYPMLIITSALAIFRIRTPLSPIAKGNWSFAVQIALAALCNGFFYELWNEGSMFFHSNIPDNPNFWEYSVPYVNYIHIFSKMPILGYFGYLAFGIMCWVIWTYIAKIIGFDSAFDPVPESLEDYK